MFGVQLGSSSKPENTASLILSSRKGTQASAFFNRCFPRRPLPVDQMTWDDQVTVMWPARPWRSYSCVLHSSDCVDQHWQAIQSGKASSGSGLRSQFEISETTDLLIGVELIRNEGLSGGVSFLRTLIKNRVFQQRGEFMLKGIIGLYWCSISCSWPTVTLAYQQCLIHGDKNSDDSLSMSFPRRLLWQSFQLSRGMDVKNKEAALFLDAPHNTNVNNKQNKNRSPRKT